MKKDKRFKVFVTDAYMICKDGTCDWANDVQKDIPEFEHKQVEQHDTLQECWDSISDWGSRWAMYSGLVIKDEEGSEVYSSIPALTKCECCKHEEWDNLVSDLSTMKDKNGKLLFPDLQS